MNTSTSECESGWTMYLDQSLNSWSYVDMKQHGEDDEDDDDLSMVSDASSGPRQKFDEDEGKVYGEKKKKTRSKKEKRFGDVDDTASSPVFTSTSSESKSGIFKKASSVAERCTSKNKQGANNEVAMKKGRDCGAQGSREELGSSNVIATQFNLKY